MVIHVVYVGYDAASVFVDADESGYDDIFAGHDDDNGNVPEC